MKKSILKYTTLLLLALSITMPTFCAPTQPTKTKPAVVQKQTAKKSSKSAKQVKLEKAAIAVEQEIHNPLYPAKYTRTQLDLLAKEYKAVSKDETFYVALDILKNTNGEFSRIAILGKNLTQRPVKLEFKDLSKIDPKYASFDALGWKKGNQLFIYINPRHQDAPAIALSALLSHEALHQDEFNSLREETYAWTMEAAIWTELLELHPDLELPQHPLVNRENTLKKLFEKGDYTDKYVKKAVYSNAGYQDLPETSPGFEDL